MKFQGGAGLCYSFVCNPEGRRLVLLRSIKLNTVFERQTNRSRLTAANTTMKPIRTSPCIEWTRRLQLEMRALRCSR
jgi:hypothetical protein